MKRIRMISLLVTIVLAAGCADGTDQAEPAAQNAFIETPAMTEVTTTESTGGDAIETGEPISLDATEELVRADLAAKLDVPQEQIETVEAISRTWLDETFQCGSRRTVVESQPVEGYQIILSTGDETFDYRADDHGHFELCPDTEGIGKPIDPIR